MDGGNAQSVVTYRDPIRACVARAAYAEIAMSAGTWSYSKLVRLLANNPHCTIDEEILKPKIRGLRDGKHAPTVGGWEFIGPALGVDLRQWIYHPLFKLLNPAVKNVRVGDRGSDVEDFAKVYHALDMLEGEIRDYVWRPPVKLERGTGTDILDISEKNLQELQSSLAFRELDWALKLTLIAALAKLSQWRGNPDVWRRTCRWTRENFVHAVAVTPQLLVGWMWLLKAFESQIWSAYRPHAHLVDFFDGTVEQAQMVRAVRLAEQCREKFGGFDALPSSERHQPPPPYVPFEFLRDYCDLPVD
jgi:hypothetical protein